MKNRILQLLISGIKPSEICNIVGCSPGYVSQLLKDEEFNKNVEVGRIQNQEEKTEEDHLDVKYTNVEHKLIASMEAAMMGASLTEISNALSVLHRRTALKQASKHPAPLSPSLTVNVVSLQLPPHALASHQAIITMNSQKEIVAIDNQPLAPMSAEGVKNLFTQLTEIKNKDQAVLEEI